MGKAIFPIINDLVELIRMVIEERKNRIAYNIEKLNNQVEKRSIGFDTMIEGDYYG